MYKNIPGFSYISAIYYEKYKKKTTKNKESLQKKLAKDINTFMKKRKRKRENMAPGNIKFSQKMKNKD